jgi:hypothetical protein
MPSVPVVWEYHRTACGNDERVDPEVLELGRVQRGCLKTKL